MSTATLEQEYVELDPFYSRVTKVSSADPVEVSSEALGVPCTWFPFARKQLRAIENLPTNWDSEGAEPPLSQTVRAASNLIATIARVVGVSKPHINPTPRGGVQFEWENRDQYFELEVLDSVNASYFYEDKAAREEAEGGLYSGQPLGDVIRYLKRFVS